MIVSFADTLEDITIPPANRLKKLSGEMKDYYIIRVNNQFRIIFIWQNNKAYQVQLIDYH